MSKTQAAAPKGKASGAQKLAREKILEAIFEVPAKDRPKLKRLLNSQIADRQGSAEWIKANPHSKPITNAEKVEMARLHDAHSLSFRTLEGIFHLIPNSGMGAYRCVLEGRALSKQKARAASRGRRTAAVA